MSDLKQNQDHDKSIGDDNTFTQAIPQDDGTAMMPSTLVEEQPADAYGGVELPQLVPENGTAGEQEESPGIPDDSKMNKTAAEKTDVEEADGYATDINMKATNGFDAAKIDNSEKKDKPQTEEEKLKALTARSKLMMLKPFKRDRSIKPIFDKKKIVKQIQKEQMEKYTQKLDMEEADYNFDFDNIDYDEEYDDEIDSDEGTDALDEFKKWAQMSCHKKLIDGIWNFIQFKHGVMFFSYDNANMSTQKTEVGNIPLRASFYDYAKIALTIIVAISLFISVIWEYFTKLGTEKSQSVDYDFLSNMTYPLADLPINFPFQFYSFFDQQEVEDQIACKVMNKNKECRKIEEKRCLSKPGGKTSEDYEDCRITILNKMNLNATNFCINHYNNMDVWKDNDSPKFAQYYQRKYACLEKTGVPRGKDYCLDIQEVTEGGDTDSLFNCYRRNGVYFGKEYCEYKLNQKTDPSITNQQVLDCYAFNNVPKGKEYCDLTHIGDDGQTIFEKTKCYESYFIQDKDYCDAKAIVNYDQTLKDCYIEAGYTLDKQFCKDAFPLDDQPSLESQLNSIYDCYQSIDLIYPNSDQLELEGGLKVFKDREYCEQLHLDDSIKKYECIETQVIPNQDEALKTACEIKNPLQPEVCIQRNKDKMVDLGLIQTRGGDFCYIKYFWQEDYEKLYECLEVEEGLPKDTSFCESQFEYHRYLKGPNGVNDKAKARCLTQGLDDNCEEQFPMNTVEELHQELWQCQSQYSSSNGEAFPQEKGDDGEDLACYSLVHDRVEFKVISKSKDGDFPNTGERTCIHAISEEEGQFPWIEATFEKPIDVNSVEFHVLSSENPATGGQGSLLAGAKIFIGDELCTTVGENLIYGYSSDVKCKDQSGTGTNPEEKEGNKVRIEATKPGVLTVCDLEVYESEHDHENESELQHDCEEAQAKCLEVFTSKQDSENKFNCLKRYGYSQKKMAQKCLELHRATKDMFYYPLMYKYQCLMDPKVITQVDDKAAECLNKFDEYSIEHCLIDYESEYETIGFYGKNKDDEVNLNPDTVEYYYYYGNLTRSFTFRRNLKFNQVQSERDELTTQVTIAQNAPEGDINTFMCDNSKMKFISNPYNFGTTDEEKTEKQIIVDLECQTFVIDHEDDEDTKPQIVVHYFMSKEPEFQGIEKEFYANDEDLKEMLFIDRNTFNEQYFELVFEDNLEFLKVSEHIMYQNEIGVQDTIKTFSLINSTEDGYNDLINKAGTRVMIQTDEHIISQNIVPEPVLQTTPEKASYYNMPNEKKTSELEMFLGIPIFFKDYFKDILLFEPELDKQLIQDPDVYDFREGKCEKCMKLKIGFAYIFERRNFKYRYYMLFDLFNALCGIGNALAQFISQFYVALVIMFAVQMNYLARQKGKQDLRRFKYEALLRKVPNFKIVIEKLLRNNYMTKEMRAKEKQKVKDKKLESIKIKKEERMKRSLKKQSTLANILDKSKKIRDEAGEDPKEDTKSPAKDDDQKEKDKHEHDKHENDKDKQDDLDGVLDNEPESPYIDDDTIRKRQPDDHIDEIYCGEEGIKEKEQLIINLAVCDELEVSLQERLQEEQDEYQDAIRTKQLTFWDLFDESFAKLENLDQRYGGLIDKKNVDFFNDDKQQMKVLKLREQANFLERAVMLKKRISFFGIFVSNDKIEHMNEQYDNMKKQFDEILKKLVSFENSLVKLSNENRPKGTDALPKFALVKGSNKTQQVAELGLKQAFMQKMQTIQFKKKATEEAEKQERRERRKSRRLEQQKSKMTEGSESSSDGILDKFKGFGINKK